MKTKINVKLEKNLCAYGILIFILSLLLLPFIGNDLILIIYIILYPTGLLSYTSGILHFSEKTNNLKIKTNFILQIAVIFLTAFILTLIGSYYHFIFPKNSKIYFIFVYYLGFVAGSFFVKKYLENIYEITKNQLFRYAGMFIFWGTIGLILPLMMFWIIEIIEFNKIIIKIMIGIIAFFTVIMGRIIEMIGFFTMPEYIENESENNK